MLDDALMQAVIDAGVLTKELVFGLVGFTMGVLLVSALLNVRAAAKSNDARAVRLSIARALLEFGVAVVLIEPLLQILGVPDLPLLDWHVLLLIAGSVLASAGAMGVIVMEDDQRRRKAP